MTTKQQEIYQCFVCLGVFTKAWSDEEADAELAEAFPGTAPDECATVCDDCYKLIMVGDKNGSH